MFALACAWMHRTTQILQGIRLFARLHCNVSTWVVHMYKSIGIYISSICHCQWIWGSVCGKTILIDIFSHKIDESRTENTQEQFCDSTTANVLIMLFTHNVFYRISVRCGQWWTNEQRIYRRNQSYERLSWKWLFKLERLHRNKQFNHIYLFKNERRQYIKLIRWPIEKEYNESVKDCDEMRKEKRMRESKTKRTEHSSKMIKIA